MKVTQEDLAQLPLQAIVCFAARAARRVFPLYTGPDQKAVGAAIEVADDFASGATLVNFAALNAAYDAFSAVNDASDASDANDARAANAAFWAAKAANTFAKPSDDAANAEAAAAAAEAAAAAAEAAKAAKDQADKADNGMLLDYAAITALVPHIGDGPWDPSESGPLGRLWPLGAPDWWPEDNTCKGKALEVTLEVSDDATTEEIAELAADVVVKLNRQNISMDGDGLLVAPNVEVMEPIREEVPSG